MFSLQLLLGRACTVAELDAKELPLPRRSADGGVYDFPATPPNKVDAAAATHLHTLLAEVENAGHGALRPVTVDGDGYCLTHSFSKHFFGLEVFYHVLRAQVHRELSQHAGWYLGDAPSSSSSSSLPTTTTTTTTTTSTVLSPPFTREELDELLTASAP